MDPRPAHSRPRSAHSSSSQSLEDPQRRRRFRPLSSISGSPSERLGSPSQSMNAHTDSATLERLEAEEGITRQDNMNDPFRFPVFVPGNQPPLQNQSSDDLEFISIFNSSHVSDFLDLFQTPETKAIHDLHLNPTEALETFNAFFRKYDALIDQCERDPIFIIRMNAVIDYTNKNSTFIKQILNIAENGLSNCNDRALGSLIEMEKAKLNHRLCTEIRSKNWSEDIALMEVISLGKQMFHLHCYEKLASDIGANEAIEVLLFLLKKIKLTGGLPIGPSHFENEQFASSLNVHRQNPSIKRLALGTTEGIDHVTEVLETLSQQHDDFVKFFAGFEGYSTYLQTYTEENKTQDKIIEKIYQLMEILDGDHPNKSHENHLQVLQNTLTNISKIDHVERLFEPNYFQSIDREIEAIKQQVPPSRDEPSTSEITLPSEGEISSIDTQTQLVYGKLHHSLMQVYNNTAFLTQYEAASNQLEIYKTIGYELPSDGFIDV